VRALLDELEHPPKPQASPEKKVPVYKRWWLWTTVGAVVVAGVGIGLGVGLSQSAPGAPMAATSEGTFTPFRGH
jgi:hypothetical protein